MLTIDKITEIFCLVDDFCKDFEKAKEGRTLTEKGSKNQRNRVFKMSDSEVITIMIMFHAGSFRNLKHFYINYVQKHLSKEFPQTVSYNRFVELQQKTTMPMAIFLKTRALGQCTGVSFIDSTPLRACHIRRERSNKVFKGTAEKGQCSIGWFYGFKLHLIINDRGEILEFMLTQGNTGDREPLQNKAFHDKIFGKLFGDKGYISQSLFDYLFTNDIHLVTKIRKNMKNSLMHINDKLLLKKRALIETVNDELKNICQIEHTRHRCFTNFLTNLISGLITYHFFPKKPSINIDCFDNKALKACA